MHQKCLRPLAAALMAAMPVPALADGDDWRAVATAADERRIASLPQAWRIGLAEARAADRAGLLRLGALVRPTGALAHPHPAPGNYRCRTIKLGRHGQDGPGFTAYGWYNCRIVLSAGGDLSLSKTTGSQRPMGRLYPYRARHLAFVGTLAVGMHETHWPKYGAQPDRNVVGVLERIGGNRYRLLMPQPAFESALDVLELVRR